MGEVQLYRRVDVERPRPAARVHAAAHRTAHDIRSQVQKEIAGINAIVGCGEAVTKLPTDLPASQRRMAERIANSAAQMIKRLAQ